MPFLHKTLLKTQLCSAPIERRSEEEFSEKKIGELDKVNSKIIFSGTTQHTLHLYQGVYKTSVSVSEMYITHSRPILNLSKWGASRGIPDLDLH